MRFNRSSRHTKVRTDVKRPGRNKRRRQRTLEMLEGRVLLAGDTGLAITPWHNALNSRDVNHDGSVSPMDALLIVNDLMLHGTHIVPAAAATPLAATGGATKVAYLDVNGDNKVSPLDALNVINQLLVPKLMEVHSFATDMAGNKITSIPLGSDFKMEVDVQDIRNPPNATPGVFSDFTNISYSSNLVSISQQSPVPGQFFQLTQGQQLDLSTPGVIPGFLAISGFPPPAVGTVPEVLYTIVVHASSPGLATFTPSFDSTAGHDSTLYPSVLLAEGDITFTSDSVQITSSPSLSIDNVTLPEGNSGQTPFVFHVDLTSVSAQQVTVQYTTLDASASVADNDYVATSGTLTFAPGDQHKTVTVLVNGDTKVESDEQFDVVLSNATGGATISNALGVGTISNDDVLPGLSIGNVTVQNATSGTTPAVFTVTLAGTVSGQATVVYATSDITAAAGVDYTATSGTLTFDAAGSQSITVPILGDPNPDDVETFLLSLSSPNNATINVGQAIGTILPAVTTPILGVTNVTKAEGTSPIQNPPGTTDFVFTATLNTAPAQNAVVTYATADDTATTANNDYIAKSGTITFAPGETSKTITISVVADNASESTEDFFVNLHSVSGATGDAQGVGTIVDDDGPPTLTIDDATISGGTSGIVNGVFTVRISGHIPQSGSVSVGFATSDGTATAGVDYLSQSGLLTFLDGGPVFQTITVPVIGNPTPQPDKTFFVNLSSVSQGAIIGDAQAVGTIVEEGITISDANVVEGNSGTTPALFTVSLSQPQDHVVTVAYQTVDGTANANSDYVPASGTVTFAVGQTSQIVTVPVVGDTLVEPNETFSVHLSNAVGSTLFGSVGTGTILNDDGQLALVRLQLADSQGNPLPANATLNLNDTFRLQAFVQDIEVPPQHGIFQAYVDALYNSNLVQITGPITYGTDFPAGHLGDTSSPGLIDEVGAIGTFPPPANPGDPKLLFSVPFKATDVGLANFSVGAAQGPNHEILIYTEDTPVPPSSVNFVNTSINIGANVIGVNNVSLTEGNAGQKNFVFTVTRFLPTSDTATVVYTTSDGTATAGQDYVAQSGTLTFANGITTQNITIAVNGDTTDEPDETFFISLSNAVNAATSNSVGIGTIINDDAPVNVSLANASASEGQDLKFVATLSAPSGQVVTVAYQTADSASGNKATAGLDYQPTSGTLTFAPGVTQQTITVHALVDSLLEPSETFQVVLSNPSHANLAVGQATGTIVDVPPAGISGFVYVDLNNNGIKDGNETGIANVTVTATLAGNTFTKSVLTNADGSFALVGLPAGTYTLSELQPGFFVDGRDTHGGIDSPTNDKFTGITLAPSGSATGFFFGELGLRSDFVTAFLNRRAFLASAIVTGEFGAQFYSGGAVNPRSGDVWISFDGGWQGLGVVDALFDSSQGSATMTLYNNSLQPVAVSFPTQGGAEIMYNGVPGAPYFLKISGNNPNVVLSFNAIAASMAVAPSAAPAQSSGSTDIRSGMFASGSPSALPSATPAATPQTTTDTSDTTVASDATDEALATDEDWTTTALLA